MYLITDLPSSFSFVAGASWLDCLAKIPHFVLGEIFLEVSKEENQVFISRDVVLLLFESLQIVLQKVLNIAQGSVYSHVAKTYQNIELLPSLRKVDLLL